MMKVRILDRCEFCDGEVSMREARRLTAIDLARCAMGGAEASHQFYYNEGLGALRPYPFISSSM